jgi:hypothetical protein
VTGLLKLEDARVQQLYLKDGKLNSFALLILGRVRDLPVEKQKVVFEKLALYLQGQAVDFKEYPKSGRIATALLKLRAAGVPEIPAKVDQAQADGAGQDDRAMRGDWKITASDTDLRGDLLQIAARENILVFEDIETDKKANDIIYKMYSKIGSDIIMQIADSIALVYDVDLLGKEMGSSPEETRLFLEIEPKVRKIMFLHKGKETVYFNKSLMEEVFHVLEGDVVLDAEWSGENRKNIRDAMEIVNDFLQLMFYPRDRVQFFESSYTNWNLQTRLFFLEKYRDTKGRNPNYQLREIIEDLAKDITQDSSIRRILGAETFPFEKYLRILLRHEKFSQYQPLFKSIKDPAQISDNLGGIDLNPAQLDLLLKGDAGQLQFKLTPAQMQMLNQNIDGFVPVILNVQPVADVPLFLGLVENEKTAS